MMKAEDCHLVDLPTVTDRRGNLTVIEAVRQIPFEIRRVYYITDVPHGETRGGHAHKQLRQFIVAASGSFKIAVDDGVECRRYSLDTSRRGIYIPPMIWCELSEFSPGAVCNVLASDHFDESDYHRSYGEFLKAVRTDASR